MAGIAFVIFYKLFKKKFQKLKIQRLFPNYKDYYREIRYSFFTVLIFAFYAYLLKLPAIRIHTKIYTNISDYGWWYMLLSFVLAVIIHDTYFYWSHRIMHHPKVFNIMHLAHHKSTNPSPWAAYAFHPFEALVEGGIIWVLVFVMPIHPLAIGLFLLFMITYNIYGHLGYEIIPNWLLFSKVGKWLNTSTNHNMHHHYFKGNYALYFRFWDIVMKTTHPKYEAVLKAFKKKKYNLA